MRCGNGHDVPSGLSSCLVCGRRIGGANIPRLVALEDERSPFGRRFREPTASRRSHQRRPVGLRRRASVPSPPLSRGPRALFMPSPIFLALIGVAAVGGLLAARASSASVQAKVGVFVFVLAGWLVTVCLHEFAHAYVAYKGGDHSVVGADYLRLNPFKYAHPLLSIGLPMLWIAYGGIGLPGGAVMIHRHQLRSRAWQSSVSLAGPAVNVAVACAAIGALHLFGGHAMPGGPGFALYAAIGWFAWLQISVTVLNLLPIPGLDGWGALEPWLSTSTVNAAQKMKPFGLLIVVGLLWTPALSEHFSALVTNLATAANDPTGLPWLGAQLFKFWVR